MSGSLLSASLASLLRGSPAAESLPCSECGAPVSIIEARTVYERMIRNRQLLYRLCERCARTASEVGEDLDGLWRKRRQLPY